MKLYDLELEIRAGPLFFFRRARTIFSFFCVTLPLPNMPRFMRLILVLLIVCQTSFAQQKQLCITVDDLPTVTYAQTDPAVKFQITKRLVDTFSNYKVEAIGYVNESKLYKNGELDSTEVQLLAYWVENGMDLGNHTYSHMNYHSANIREYGTDILKGEKVTKSLLKANGKELRYFRHPYLRVGLSQANYDSLQTFLDRHGYIPAPVTIDNTDYLFALAYSRAVRDEDQELQEKIGRDYVDYMEQKLLFYEMQSDKLFSRPIAQTLLTHANLLNATFMPRLLDMYKAHGYTFVSQEEVLKDPAYDEEVSVFGQYGISWLDRWALSKGLKGDFFKGDPETPEYIVRMTR